MKSKFEMYKDKIEQIEYCQRHFDPMWGYASYEDTKSAYISLSLEISGDVDLNEEVKNTLNAIIDDKRKKMPEVAEEVRKYEEELHASVTNEAKERYKKLSILKKLKLILLKKDPKNIAFENLDVVDIDRLYGRKRY